MSINMRQNGKTKHILLSVEKYPDTVEYIRRMAVAGSCSCPAMAARLIGFASKTYKPGADIDVASEDSVLHDADLCNGIATGAVQ